MTGGGFWLSLAIAVLAESVRLLSVTILLNETNDCFGCWCFLYRKHFAEGWYPTFMPLVSIVPGVILMTGGGFWLSLAIAVLAGISAAPVGNYIAKRLPPFVPGAVGFVSGMAVVTICQPFCIHLIFLYSE